VSTLLIALLVAAAALGAGAGALLVLRRRRRPEPGTGRVLFPIVGRGLSKPGLDAALRIARADGATLIAAYLAPVPLHLPLDAALTRECQIAIPLLEAVEQRAAAAGVPVVSRIERGRTYRHGLLELIDHEPFDRIVVTAAPVGAIGFSAADVAWMLRRAPGEIVVLRPVEEGPMRPAGGTDAPAHAAAA
jgi:nucleotide-binding universal stress UspA family protein